MADVFSRASAPRRPLVPPFWALPAVLLLALALRLFFAAGISGNDDLSVANGAIGILEHGIGLPGGHYGARFGLTLPLALIFRVAGVGVGSLILLPMLASLLGVWLAWWLGSRLFDQRAALLRPAQKRTPALGAQDRAGRVLVGGGEHHSIDVRRLELVDDQAFGVDAYRDNFKPRLHDSLGNP